MRQTRKLNQQGAVSIITVVIFATIVTIIASIYARASVDQQRQAVAYDFGTRAYFAAESGVQDAIRGINNGSASTKTANSCLPLVDGTAPLNKARELGNGKGYTCQLISVTPKSIEGTVIPTQQTAQIQIQPPAGTPTGNFTLVINWSANDGTHSYVGRPDAAQLFPSLSDWTNNKFYPVLRTAVIDHGASFTRNTIAQHVYLSNPVAGNSTVPVPSFAPSSYSQSEEEIIQNAHCQTSGSFACQQKITLSNFNFDTNKVYVRISSIYASTKFSLSLESNGTPLPLSNAQASIDVTGYSGNVYRRVRQSVPIGSGYIQDPSLDAALAGGDGICKHFAVTTDATQFASDCDPSK